MLEAVSVAINRGKRRVLSDVSFTVSDGELVGVVGPLKHKLLQQVLGRLFTKAEPFRLAALSH